MIEEDGLQEIIPPICDMCPTLIDASTCTEHDGLYLCPRCSVAADAEAADAEVPIVCEVCGKKEGCICIMENGMQKTICLDCIPKENRKKAFDNWELTILGDDGEEAVANVQSRDQPAYLPTDEYPDLIEAAGPDSHTICMLA